MRQTIHLSANLVDIKDINEFMKERLVIPQNVSMEFSFDPKVPNEIVAVFDNNLPNLLFMVFIFQILDNEQFDFLAVPFVGDKWNILKFHAELSGDDPDDLFPNFY